MLRGVLFLLGGRAGAQEGVPGDGSWQSWGRQPAWQVPTLHHILHAILAVLAVVKTFLFTLASFSSSLCSYETGKKPLS